MANTNQKSTTTAGVVFSSPGQSPSNPLAGQPVVATGSVAAKTTKVSGQVTGTAVIISNPA